MKKMRNANDLAKIEALGLSPESYGVVWELCFDEIKEDMDDEERLVELTIPHNCETKEANLSGCARLRELRCYSGALQKLNISDCGALEEIECRKNRLTDLDLGLPWLSRCIYTQWLSSTQSISSFFYAQPLSDFSRLRQGLYPIYFKEKLIATLDVSRCRPGRYQIRFEKKPIASFDVSRLMSLRKLDCYGNWLQKLDLSGCVALKSLRCQKNKLSELDVSGCESLQSLDCSDNALQELDLMDCRALKSINCSKNNLRELDVSNSPFLLKTRFDSDLVKMRIATRKVLKNDTLLFIARVRTNRKWDSLAIVDSSGASLSWRAEAGFVRFEFAPTVPGLITVTYFKEGAAVGTTIIESVEV